MNLDDKISQALAQESQEIDKLVAEENSGLFGMLFATWRGGMRYWVLLINVVTLLFTVLLVWCGYQFWISEIAKEQIFWGVSVLAVLQIQISLKMWLFMEMNRMSTVREIKRVEIAVARLAQ
jgi:hypothetical protein